MPKELSEPYHMFSKRHVISDPGPSGIADLDRSNIRAQVKADYGVYLALYLHCRRPRDIHIPDANVKIVTQLKFI